MLILKVKKLKELFLTRARAHTQLRRGHDEVFVELKSRRYVEFGIDWTNLTKI
jgi:hypothetical protein